MKNNKLFNRYRKTIHALGLLVLTGGCANIHTSSIDVDDVTRSTHFQRQEYNFKDFPILGLKKMEDQSVPVISIYIEGDGYSYISRSRPSSNPTPKNPVGLNIALKDGGPNVVYLGRPCQYADKKAFEISCDKKYWTTHRFSHDVITAYNRILDELKADDKTIKFDLIGFSGGANIVGLLAASRDDVASMRTVAGDVDNDFFTAFHKVSDMPHSMNMADYTVSLSGIPQLHFIAEDDKFVPVDIYQSYRAKLPTVKCTQASIVKGTTHLDGWVDRWPELLSKAPMCQ